MCSAPSGLNALVRWKRGWNFLVKPESSSCKYPSFTQSSFKRDVYLLLELESIAKESDE